MVLVLLSAHFERFIVSCTRDLFVFSFWSFYWKGRAVAEKAKTFRVAGFGGQKFPDEKLVFLGVYAEKKRRKLKFWEEKKVPKLYFFYNPWLYVCFCYM